jgi:hypothetical protein
VLLGSVRDTPGCEDGEVNGKEDLEALLAGLSPRRRSGEYVFVVADPSRPIAEQDIVASVVESEGRSLVLDRRRADEAGLAYDFVAGWITLEVRSKLDAVGLTAAVAAALAEAGMTCNVIAGYHHDHLLVAQNRVDEAIAVLEALSASHRDDQAGFDVHRVLPPDGL